MVSSLLGFLGILVKMLARYGVLLIAVLLLISLTRNIVKVISVRDRLVEARSRLETERLGQRELEEMLARVQSDLYKEQQARDKLNLARDGERIVILPDEEVLKRLSPRVIKKEQYILPDPNWKKWLDLFVQS